MEHSGIVQLLSNMRWKVLDFTSCGIPLLTSDRPVWKTAALVEPDDFLFMPIGPSRLFVAANAVSSILRLQQQSRRELAKKVNKLTVQHAVNLVFGVDAGMKSFVQKHFATKRHSTIIADDSPSKLLTD
jgi:Protein of unknown function (DUF4238)